MVPVTIALFKLENNTQTFTSNIHVCTKYRQLLESFGPGHDKVQESHDVPKK